MKKWETKQGAPFKLDVDKAVKIMEDEIQKYLANNKTENMFTKIPTGENTAVLKGNVDFLTLDEIALMCGVAIETLKKYAVAKNDDGSWKNEQLNRSYDRYKTLEKILLQKGGLTGAYPSNVVAFLLSANHGLTPKTATESKVESTIDVRSMDAVYEQLDNIHNKELERIEEQRAEMEKRKGLLGE